MTIIAPHSLIVETISTCGDSTHEIHTSENMSPSEQQSAEYVWSVMMPSETVLHCDRLVESFSLYGNVLNVSDIDE